MGCFYNRREGQTTRKLKIRLKKSQNLRATHSKRRIIPKRMGYSWFRRKNRLGLNIARRYLRPNTIVTPIGVIIYPLRRKPRSSTFCFLVNERPHKERGATGGSLAGVKHWPNKCIVLMAFSQRYGDSRAVSLAHGRSMVDMTQLDMICFEFWSA